MLFGARKDASHLEAIRRIKDWAGELFGATEHETVMVNELRCTEPGCPPVETVIALLGAGTDKCQVKVHKAAVEVTHEDVRQALAGRYPHDHGG